MGPSARQRDVLVCIARSIRERGYPPTWREIGSALGIQSTNGVTEHVAALRRKGLVYGPANGKRTLLLTDDGTREAARWIADMAPRCPRCEAPADCTYRCLGCQAFGCRACCRCSCPAIEEAA